MEEMTHLTFKIITALLSSPFSRGEAYLDPGSGSYLLQLLLAGLLGSLVVIRASWDKIKGFFSKRSKQEGDTDTDEEE